MPSKKSVIRPVVLAVSALFATGVYAADSGTSSGNPPSIQDTTPTWTPPTAENASVIVGTQQGVTGTLGVRSEGSEPKLGERYVGQDQPPLPVYIYDQTTTTLNGNEIVLSKQTFYTDQTNQTGTDPRVKLFTIKATEDGAAFVGKLDLTKADVTGLFDPAKAGALSQVTTLNAGSQYNVNLESGAATLGAATLGATTTNGITNTGNISTDTLSTSGLATLKSATVGGTLDVSGATTTKGINNTGDITNTGDVSTSTLSTSGLAKLNSAAITNNATVGGTFGVTGVTTLNGATTVNNILNVNGATTIVGATSVTGATTIVGTTNINTTGNAATTIGNAAAAATLVGNVVSAAGGDLGNSGLTLKNGEASLTVKNAQGNTHGLVVGESSTTLSGGTSSTNLTLNDSGATFSNAATGAPTRVTGVANGAGDFDAVNVRQFSAAVAGVAASANIPGLDTNKTTSVGVGLGSYMNSQALAFGGSYRFSDKGVLRASLATGLNTGGSKTTFGIGAGWSW